MASALLLIPTGLFMKSLVNLLQVDLGIRVENMMTFRISPELNRYKPAQSRALIKRAEQQLSAIPGVRGVATSMVPLLDGSNSVNSSPATQTRIGIRGTTSSERDSSAKWASLLSADESLQNATQWQGPR